MTQNVHLRTSSLTFSVQQCKNIGKEGDKDIFDIDVEFDVDHQDKPILDPTQSKKAGFIVKAKSLEVALESIEALGRQTQKMNVDKFNEFKSKHATTVFRTVHHENKETLETTLTIFKNNRAHNCIKHAFAKPRKGFVGPHVPLTRAQRKEISQLALRWGPFDRAPKPKESLKFDVRDRN